MRDGQAVARLLAGNILTRTAVELELELEGDETRHVREATAKQRRLFLAQAG